MLIAAGHHAILLSRRVRARRAHLPLEAAPLRHLSMDRWDLAVRSLGGIARLARRLGPSPRRRSPGEPAVLAGVGLSAPRDSGPGPDGYSIRAAAAPRRHL